MPTNIGSFAVDLKVKGDTLTLRDMVSKMADMRLMTLGEITALGVLGEMLKNTGLQAMGMSSGYTTLNQTLGINTDLLQRWQNVARATNVPIEAVAASFANVQKTLTGFKQGVVNDQFLRGASLLGIGRGAAGMSYDQLMEALRVRVPEVLRTHGAAYTSEALSKIGIDPAMIQMFKLSPGAFRAQEYNSGIINSRQVREWTELNNQVTVLKNKFFIWSEVLLTKALPGMIAFAEWISKADQAFEGWLGKKYSKASDVASAPYDESRLGGPVQRAIMSLIAPDFVASKSASSLNVSHNQTNNFNVGGGPDYTLIPKIHESVRKANQEQLTYTFQAFSPLVTS